MCGTSNSPAQGGGREESASSTPYCTNRRRRQSSGDGSSVGGSRRQQVVAAAQQAALKQALHCHSARAAPTIWQPVRDAQLVIILDAQLRQGLPILQHSLAAV